MSVFRNKKTIVCVILFVLFGAFNFLWGYASSERQIFPSSYIRYGYFKTHNLLRYYDLIGGGSTARNRIKHQVTGAKGLGYLGGVEESGEKTGLLTYEPSKSHGGYTLYVSGHAPEALLLAPDGKVVHRWKTSYEDAFGAKVPGQPGNWTNLVNAYLYPNGELLCIFTNLGLVKLGPNSEVIWSRKNNAHHDFWVSTDGTIYVLAHKMNLIPDYNYASAGYEEMVMAYAPDGTLKDTASITKAIAKSDYVGLPDFIPVRKDAIHNNTLTRITEVPENVPPAFEEGRFLISSRRANFFGVFDFENETLPWALAGLTRGQHHPTMLTNGNILVFDNYYRTEQSRVIELNPTTHEIEWMYTDEGFYSGCCGSAHRLPNGNTLITETNAGRIIEVTHQKDIVWEYKNPLTINGKVGQVYKAHRYSTNYFDEDFLSTGN